MTAKILIIDDNDRNRKLATEVLQFGGHVVVQASSAAEARALLADDVPDLILMDIAMPGMDGLALTRLLKLDPATSRIPIVALTANAMKGDAEKGLQAGCDGYITKPINTRTFAQSLARWIGT